jgi:hypothetical protein
VSLADLPDDWGFLQAEWEALRAQMREGDEIWQFANRQSTWDSLSGRAGIALVRDGQITAYIVTLLS